MSGEIYVYVNLKDNEWLRVVVNDEETARSMVEKLLDKMYPGGWTVSTSDQYVFVGSKVSDDVAAYTIAAEAEAKSRRRLEKTCARMGIEPGGRITEKIVNGAKLYPSDTLD